MTIISALSQSRSKQEELLLELNLLQKRQTEPMGEIRTLENVNNVLGIDNKAVERNAGRQPDIYPGLQEGTSQKV